MESLFLAIRPALADEAAASMGFFGDDLDTGFLLVALLLAFLLLARVHRRDRVVELRPPTRSHPTTYDELARQVYRMVVTADLAGYRGLFMAGGEAAEVLGEGAEDYLASRGLEVLEESLVTIGATIPEGASYHGVRFLAGERLELQVRSMDDRLVNVDLGTVTRIGAVVRLVEPPFRG